MSDAIPLFGCELLGPMVVPGPWALRDAAAAILLSAAAALFSLSAVAALFSSSWMKNKKVDLKLKVTSNSLF